MEMISPGNFATVARSVIRFLHGKLGFDLWMVTRTEGEDWIVLQAEDHGYGVGPNNVFRWADSFCSQMVLGKGPRIAPHSAAVPAYAAAPIGRAVPIGAYVGIPLTYIDGSLFGTLCAIHPTPKSEALDAELPMLELLASMLSSLLHAEMMATERERQVERARQESETDELTGLYNLRGWNRLLAAEEDRCNRFGHGACIIAIDLDGLKSVNDEFGHAAGDDLIRRAGAAIGASVRDVDVVARVGGDEFLVLGVECDRASGAGLAARIEAWLSEAGVPASAGYAVRRPAQGMEQAIRDADAAMYEKKNVRRTTHSVNQNY